jgi:acyl carrier protein
MTWTTETVRSEIRKVFQQHVQGSTAVSDTSHLVADLGIDSLGQMEVVAEIEDTFKLRIPDEALRHIETVADVTAAIESRLKDDGRLAV